MKKLLKSLLNIKRNFKKYLINIPYLAKKLGLIHNFMNTKDWLIQNKNLEDNYFVMLPPEQIKLKKPKTVETELWEVFNLDKIDLQEVFAAVIPDGNYIPRFSSYVIKDKILLNDLSLEFGAPRDKEGFEHSVFSLNIPKETYYDRTIAIIDSAGADNYFHWMINILPKIEFFQKTKLNIDHYVVNIEKPFQKESLEFINFPFEKIIPNNKDLNIKAKFLIGSSLPSSPGILNSQSLEFLKNKFNLPKKLEKRVFITRRNATQGRKILNEQKVINLIKNYGFEVYELEKMSFYEQMELFSSASIILAPHGAGLTNMIFCHPEVKIIEIFNPKYRALCYWLLSNLMNLDYYYILGEGKRLSIKEVSYDCSGNIIVDLNKLEKTLKIAGL